MVRLVSKPSLRLSFYDLRGGFRNIVWILEKEALLPLLAAPCNNWPLGLTLAEWLLAYFKVIRRAPVPVIIFKLFIEILMSFISIWIVNLIGWSTKVVLECINTWRVRRIVGGFGSFFVVGPISFHHLRWASFQSLVLVANIHLEGVGLLSLVWFDWLLDVSIGLHSLMNWFFLRILFLLRLG